MTFSSIQAFRVKFPDFKDLAKWEGIHFRLFAL